MKYILLHDWAGNMGGKKYSVQGWQYWPGGTIHNPRTEYFPILRNCNNYMTLNGSAMATDFVYLHFFTVNPLSSKNEVHSVASYKQGYGNNEHVATAWLLSVELKCWFLAQAP